jgi:ribosomal protein S18 acetylase RimI-like enzyme
MEGLITLTTEAQIQQAAQIMVRAFAADPLIPYLLPNPADRSERALAYYAANLRHGVLYGEAFATPGFEGAVTWLKPHQTNWSQDKLNKSGMGQMAQLFGDDAWGRFWQLVSLPMPKAPEPNWYLLLLGVEPGHQRQGFGHRLIAPLLTQADAGGETIRLETNNEHSLPFYKREGFELKYAGQVNAVMPQWALERPAKLTKSDIQENKKDAQS